MIQKQLFADIPRNRCFQKLSIIHRKYICWSHILTPSWRRPQSSISPFIYSSNQRTGFYIMGASVMKELTKLQVSRPETSLKRDSSTGILLWILRNVSKNLIYRKIFWWMLLLIPPFQPMFYQFITLFLLLLLIISIIRVCSESVLKSVFFSIFVMERLYSTLKTILCRQ